MIPVVTNKETRTSYRYHPMFGVYEINPRTLGLATYTTNCDFTQHTHTHTHTHTHIYIYIYIILMFSILIQSNLGKYLCIILI